MLNDLIDTYGRRINYLRLSVTDRCDLRCRYCMPAHGIPKLQHAELLSYEELYRVASSAVSLGIEKIRITGGEPLVRKGLIGFLEQVGKLPGLRELVLTTNGMQLQKLASRLYRAGVARLNVSLDSLKPETFASITRGGELQRVLDGLAAAEQAGFPPVKINMVAMRGVNDDEILDFARLTLKTPLTVRFIEYMPTLKEKGWYPQRISGAEILERIAKQHPLVPISGEPLAGPARNFRIEGAAGSIGVITPVSGHFCEGCNRIRVTSSGLAAGCLFSDQSIDLKPLLRTHSPEALTHTLRSIVQGKPGRHQLAQGFADNPTVAMSRVGG